MVFLSNECKWVCKKSWNILYVHKMSHPGNQLYMSIVRKRKKPYQYINIKELRKHVNVPKNLSARIRRAIGNNNLNRNVCSICGEVINAKDSVAFHHGVLHKFHFSCMNKYHNISKSSGRPTKCPICRTDVTKVMNQIIKSRHSKFAKQWRNSSLKRFYIERAVKDSPFYRLSRMGRKMNVNTKAKAFKKLLLSLRYKQRGEPIFPSLPMQWRDMSLEHLRMVFAVYTYIHDVMYASYLRLPEVNRPKLRVLPFSVYFYMFKGDNNYMSNPPGFAAYYEHTKREYGSHREWLVTVIKRIIPTTFRRLIFKRHHLNNIISNIINNNNSKLPLP
jgi:hypothetical protein